MEQRIAFLEKQGAEKDALIHAVVKERDTAVQERHTAVQERDTAVQEMNEKDAVIASLQDALHGQGISSPHPTATITI